jgi:hypothetical protein
MRSGPYAGALRFTAGLRLLRRLSTASTCAVEARSAMFVSA